MKAFVARLWNEPALFLAALAGAADAILVAGLSLPVWVIAVVHVLQAVATRAAVSPARLA